MSTLFLRDRHLSVLRDAVVCAVLVGCVGAASAAVTYRYQSPVLYPNSQYIPGYDNVSAPRLAATAVFDDSVVTADFTGTANAESASMGWLGSSSSQTNAWSDTFNFVNGQVTNWYLTLYIPHTYLHPYRGVVHYSEEVIASSAYGDWDAHLDLALYSRYGSLTGEQGSWTRESAPAVVPLPLSLPLLACGLAGFGLFVRRKPDQSAHAPLCPE